MISDNIKKEGKTLTERGLHDQSFFEVEFTDGSSLSEHSTNWSDISERSTVEYFGGKKIVSLCIHPVKIITIKHQDLNVSINVPEGCRVYQAIRSESFYSGISGSQIIGRVVGIVKDGEVIKENFLDGLEGTVSGIKN